MRVKTLRILSLIGLAIALGTVALWLHARHRAGTTAGAGQPAVREAPVFRPSAQALGPAANDPSGPTPNQQPAGPSTDPIERMNARLLSRRHQQLAGLQRMCDISDAGLIRAGRVLEAFHGELTDLAHAGRAGRISQTEFAAAERAALKRMTAAWCSMLTEGQWGPERCRELAAECPKALAVANSNGG